ncbi:MAG: DUF484 family protein [Gammaproteobacteria bacterium]|nr:DUF484 family protein [Gammaproteobacteria bacterium]MXX95539.1 DUF484 family protein [Gammaproteobacteria bacterium]MYF52802.1 DUF484 family protein [Gammaproteobacteria bacterium]MYK42760.1 DUF484 family protein [Gammaproteobacteria bacterium]
MSTVISHRLSLLEDTNDQLKQQLESLFEIGERNEQRFVWLKELVLELLITENTNQLDRTLYSKLSELENIDDVLLFIFVTKPKVKLKHIRDTSLSEVPSRLVSLSKTICEVCRANEYRSIFNVSIDSSGSFALIPYQFKDIQGVLAIGSSEPARFAGRVDTLFLDFLGEVVARVVSRIS